MKIMRLIIGLLMSIVLGGVLYLHLDKKLFYYGNHNFKVHQLPFGITPEYRPDFEDGFALRDRYGFTIAAKGNTYNFANEKISIAEVTSYCFDETSLTAHVKDVSSRNYFAKFSGSSNSAGSELEVHIDKKVNNQNSLQSQCYSIENNTQHIRSLQQIRLSIAFALASLCLGFIFSLIIYLKKSGRKG